MSLLLSIWSSPKFSDLFCMYRPKWNICHGIQFDPRMLILRALCSCPSINPLWHFMIGFLFDLLVSQPVGIWPDQTKRVTRSHNYQTNIILLWPHHRGNRIIRECFNGWKSWRTVKKRETSNEVDIYNNTPCPNWTDTLLFSQ